MKSNDETNRCAYVADCATEPGNMRQAIVLPTSSAIHSDQTASMPIDETYSSCRMSPSSSLLLANRSSDEFIAKQASSNRSTSSLCQTVPNGALSGIGTVRSVALLSNAGNAVAQTRRNCCEFWPAQSDNRGVRIRIENTYACSRATIGVVKIVLKNESLCCCCCCCCCKYIISLLDWVAIVMLNERHG